MTDRQDQIEAHNRATAAFIDLANDLAKQQGQDSKIVSAALMAASGIYATFITAGNNGYLGPNGVDQVADLYKRNLAYVQDRKRQEMEAKGLKPVRKADADAQAMPADQSGETKPDDE